jgi:uncharacterized protein (TIGR03435 family)
MVKQLLSDRFKLRVHSESRPVDAFVLLIARPDGKLGPGLRPARVGCQRATAAAAAAGATSLPPTPPGQRPDCGESRTIKGGVTEWRGNGMTLGTFLTTTNAQFLVGRPMLDRTGLKDAYDIDLDYVAEDPGRQAPESKEPTLGSSYVTAVREQLGLKFERRKEPLPVLIIDHVEAPTPD